MATFQCSVGGKTLVVETGKLAGQADAAVTVRFGDTLVLVTTCVASQPRVGMDFLPLTIDFEERFYAAGKIPGGFFRREGRPSQDATLSARLTDRTLRPLFPKGFRHEVHIVVTVLSADQEQDPDVLGIVGGSAALSLSSIPFNGPVSAVRVGSINGEWVLNPTFAQIQESQFDLVAAGTKEAMVMLEAGAKEVPEAVIVEAIRRGKEANMELLRLQEDMISLLGKPKMEFQPLGSNQAAREAMATQLAGRLDFLLHSDKAQRETAIDELRREVMAKLSGTFPTEELSACFEAIVKEKVRQIILGNKARLGGRAYHQLRPISTEVGLLPRAHGSGLFQRGMTQVLTTATLGSMGMEQVIDTISPEESKRFIHHYNFPPYSTGEVGRIGSPGRREVGHGALAERALTPVIPSEADFPYTIRLVSDVLSSNGSTSMGSVCGSSLALMDAGVPIKTPVAGVAMGLITQGDGQYAILTDIEGVEDAYGDMDFKVAGTAQGITALQMDIKLRGINLNIIEQALNQAREARLQILDKMRQTIPASRLAVSPFAPKIYKITINPDKIGAVIGSGGKTIRAIVQETGATVDIENDGTVYIGSTNEEQAQKAIKIVQSLAEEVKLGTIYTGKVTRLMSIGAMVEILPNKEGLVPLRELADFPVQRAGDVLKIGDEVTVKVMEVDRQGRVNLSRRAVLEGTSGETRHGEGAAPRPPRPDDSHPRRPFYRRPPKEGS